MDIRLYTFEDRDGTEYGAFSTPDAHEARDYARRNKVRMIANTYVFDDSELVEDYTDEPA